MVISIREQERRREEQHRLERLTLVRRQAFEHGVASARHYEQAKRAQSAAVRSAVRDRCAADARGRGVALTATMNVAAERRGDGMRAAAQLVAERGAAAQEELAAWEGERALDAMRHDLALQRLRFERDRGADERQTAQQRKLAVQAAEAERSRRAIERSRSTSTLMPQSVNAPSRFGVAGAGGSVKALVTLAAAEGQQHERADAAAPGHEAQREEERRRQSARVRELRRDAQKRAREAVMHRRHEELMRQQEAARASALQKQMVEAAMKLTGKPGYAEFQEEEARRAQRINHRAHLEFEKTFLASDGWEVADVQRLTAREAVPDADDTATLFDPERMAASGAFMLSCAYALPCRSLHPHEIGHDAPAHSIGADDDGGEAELSEPSGDEDN
jgi:hypothetical protein